MALLCWSGSPAFAAPPESPRKMAADALAEVQAIKAELDIIKERLRTQETESRKREEKVRQEGATAVEAARLEAEQRMTAERAAWQAESQRLQQEMQAAAAREEARRQAEPPTVGASAAGVSLTGYLQSDLVFRQSSESQLNPTSGVPLNEDRFLIRRARLMLDMDRRYGEGGLELDANTVNGPVMRLLGARASIKLPGRESGDAPLLMASIGSFRAPFGLEVLQSDVDRPFMERSTASRAFFPTEFDLGARLQGAWRFVRYAVAVMNGEPMGERSFPALDPNHQKDVLGRVGVNTGPSPTVSVAGGLSGLYGTGFSSGQLASKGAIGWVDNNGNGVLDASEVRGTAGTSASPSRNFERFALGADVHVAAALVPGWTTTIDAEFSWAKNLDRGIQPANPFVLSQDAREIGYYAALTQALGRHVLVGVRYDFYNPDRDRYVLTAGDKVPSNLDYSTWAFMAALVAPWGRLMVQYDLNRNHLGLSNGGTPGNLADNAFTLRGEVRF
jgi:hypothetical protein